MFNLGASVRFRGGAKVCALIVARPLTIIPKA
jgi:hypothetical protein